MIDLYSLREATPFFFGIKMRNAWFTWLTILPHKKYHFMGHVLLNYALHLSIKSAIESIRTQGFVQPNALGSFLDLFFHYDFAQVGILFWINPSKCTNLISFLGHFVTFMVKIYVELYRFLFNFFNSINKDTISIKELWDHIAWFFPSERIMIEFGVLLPITNPFFPVKLPYIFFFIFL